MGWKCFPLVIVLFSAQLSIAQVVFTEIMFNPLGSDTHDEFIELLNLSASDSVDMTGWQIGDGNGTDMILPVSGRTRVAPGHYVVILDASYLENSTTYEAIIPPGTLRLTIDNSTFGSGGLSNSTAETITIFDSSGTTISEYQYSTGNAQGISDEKILPEGDNSTANWADSHVLFGTPGLRNSVSPLNFDLVLSNIDVILPEEADAQVRLMVTVRNDGLKIVEAFEVSLFEDVNRDSILQQNELLGQPFEFSGGISPGDSTEFTADIGRLSSGTHLVFARIYFGADQDLSDNMLGQIFEIGFSPGIIVINEIMHSPLESQTEWIEIYNTGDKNIDLSDWSVSDSDTSIRERISTNLMLGAGEYHVLAGDLSLFDLFDISSETVTQINMPSLNNAADDVVLFDQTERIIDRVSYLSEWGGARGISLEKVAPELQTNQSANWSGSVDIRGGTPGEQNSIFTETLPAKTTLSVQPNPFSPDGDGIDDFALIKFDLPFITSSVNIKIYDMHGRLIRFLVNNQPASAHSVFVWDGRDDDGQKARIGIYVVFLQSILADSGRLEISRTTVVLAGKL